MQLIHKSKATMKRLRITFLLLATMVVAPALLHAQIIKGELFVGGNATQVNGDECYRYRKYGVHAGAGALIPITNWMDVGLEVLFNQKGAYKRDSINQHLGLYTGRYNLRLNYAEVPVMLYFTDKNRYSIGIGVSYGRVVGLKESVNGIPTAIGIGDGQLHWREDNGSFPDISQAANIDELTDLIYEAGYSKTEDLEVLVPRVVKNSENYRGRDFCICADARVRLWEGIHAELRYQYSLMPIRTRLFYKDVDETHLKIDDRRVQPLQHQYNNVLTLRVVYIFNERRSTANKTAPKY